MPAYDAAWVRAHYDSYGRREWDRWDTGPVQMVRFAVHMHYLRTYLKPDDRVLEIGAGAGRFTRELAQITEHITAADISPVQLKLNRENAAEYGFTASVEQWVECDMCDLSQHFGDQEFDAIVCYGGPLSYTLERRLPALRELKRVTKSGGTILLSVMSLLGTMHQWLTDVLDIDPAINLRVLRTGDVTEQEASWSVHRHHLFRAEELRGLLESAGLVVLSMSASNSISAAWDKGLQPAYAEHGKWRHLLDLEIEASRSPGCLDMGTHIIAVCRT